MIMAPSEIFEMAPYVEKASRLELVIRWLYGIVIGIIYEAWAFYIWILATVQFFHILIFGRRGARLYRSTRRYLAALTHVYAYLWFLTDQRPELTPDLMVFFERLQAATPAYVQPSTTATRYCVSCGASIQPDAKFCGICGAKQN